MRTIGVVTVARSDYGILLPLMRKIYEEPDLQLKLIVSGMHLSPEFGLTVKAIEAEGFPIAERVEMLLSSDTPEGIAKSVGLGIISFSQTFTHFRPDILVVLGDRFEMYAAVLAALPFNIPVAHIHGGEVTLGAFDDALRHSITKLAHLHFASTEEYAQRIHQMGEEKWRISISGAPSLDNLHAIQLMTASELNSRYRLNLQKPTLLVTFHPITLEYDQTEWQIKNLLAALNELGMPVVFTLPNADTNGRIIVNEIKQFVETHESARIIDNLGTIGYFSLMSSASAMVGNSSSGIIEAASFKLPVVNIGIRQCGRLKPENVIDTGYDCTEIIESIKKAASSRFRDNLRELNNPYGCGNASEKIVKTLKNVKLDKRLIVKKFCDL